MTAPVIPLGYLEHQPPPALRPFVECFWRRRALPSSGAHRILPDGCIDIVVGHRANAAPFDTALAVGTMTRALVLDADRSESFVGVRFRPGRALPFVGVPAVELTDHRVEIVQLGRSRALSLDVEGDDDPDAVLRELERVLLRRLADAPPPHRTVDAAIRAILRAGGNLSIAALAPALGVTRQHLARAFALYVGIPPKTFARIARVRGVLARARVAAQVDWVALALDAGYCDQAHLAGEVKELTGLTPTAWMGNG